MLYRSIFATVFLCLLGDVAFAQKTNIERAETFVQSVVASDFKGKPDGRLDHTLYTTPASYKFGPKREIYFLDADPLVVVASWRVGKAKVLGDHDVEYPVEFGVLAVSEGTGVPSWFRPTGRELRVVPSATTKRITYKLRYASGRWNLVDPPPPCVGVIALIAFFQNDLKQLLAARRAYTLNKVGPHALENNLLIEQWERKQLKFLLSLHQSIAGH